MGKHGWHGDVGERGFDPDIASVEARFGGKTVDKPKPSWDFEALGPPEPIIAFEGEYRYLSNFYDAPMWYGGIKYPRSENAFQAAKTWDPELRRIIARMTARESKAAGKHLDCRPDWDEVRVPVMGEIVTLKFIQNPGLLRRLMNTGNRTLIEGNWWKDDFWGVYNGKGENWLGQILMDLRNRMWGVRR
jgi:ribA/ribD-fused uncharacterized protein